MGHGSDDEHEYARPTSKVERVSEVRTVLSRFLR
jgi:hypothetical protein